MNQTLSGMPLFIEKKLASPERRVLNYIGTLHIISRGHRPLLEGHRPLPRLEVLLPPRGHRLPPKGHRPFLHGHRPFLHGHRPLPREIRSILLKDMEVGLF
jgi:hypothetical protein